MAIKTQTELYEEINEAHTEFLKKCADIQHHKDCDQSVVDAIDDMLNGCMDALVDIEVAAQKFDEDDGEPTVWEIEGDRYDDMRKEC